MTSSRLLRFAKLATALALTLYALICLVAINEAYAVRRHPPAALIVERFLTSSWPHRVIGRYVVLLPGAPEYHRAILPTVLAAPLVDTPWNRYMVGRFVAASPDDAFDSALQDYRLPPSGWLTERLSTHLEGGGLAAIPVLARTDTGARRIESWTKSRLRALPRDRQLAALPYLVALGVDRAREALQSMSVSSDDLATALNLFDVQAGRQALPGLTAFVTSEADGGHLRFADVVSFVSSLLQQEDTVAAPVAKIVMRHLASVPVSELPSLLGIESCESNDTQHGNDCGWDATPEVAGALFVAAFKQASGDPASAATIFHFIAHNLPDQAVQLTKEACRSPDSTLAKAVVVLSVRHEIPENCPDRAFAGSAPRETLFRSFGQYADGSRAADEYSMLAGHGFFGVGKQWPPYYGTRDPEAAHVAAWQAFVDRYPWYPAVDDAYYRLAYAHLLQGDRRGAIDVVHRYRKLVLLDDDSTPYLDHIELVARAEEGEHVDTARIRDSRDALPDRLGDFDGRWSDLLRSLEAVDWLLRASNLTGPVPSRAQLIALRQRLERERARCSAEPDLRRCPAPDAAVKLLLPTFHPPPVLLTSMRAVFTNQ